MNNALPICFALLAAVLYALSAPLAKILLQTAAPTVLAGLLYLGAGAGMGLLNLGLSAVQKQTRRAGLSRRDLPYTLGMVGLDIAAPVLLLVGLVQTPAENVALINNFEIVATAIIALFVFKERISARLWGAIGLITTASIMLCWRGEAAFAFSKGSLYVLGACVCWGLENNCTRMLSNKNLLEVVTVKGLGAGAGALCIGIFMGETLPTGGYLAAALGLGFVAYGLSIFFYMLAQRHLGAAKTSVYYAVAPFVGVGVSLLIFKETPPLLFWAALLIMACGAYLSVTDTQYDEVNKK